MNFEETIAEIMDRRQVSSFSLEQFLFKEQLDFVRDPSPFKTAVCTRRSGKTVACASDLTEINQSNDNVTSLYLTLSRSNAKRIVWPELKKINRDFNLGCIPNESDLSMRNPKNDSIIYLAGASDRTEIEKFRGLALKKVYLDESQSFPPYVRELIDDVIGPALMDHAGTLCLIGTPGPVPAGFFYDCSQSPDWSHHAWSFFDNPWIASKSGMTHQSILERELKRRGVTIEDPTIQREWFGKWTLDSDALVFHYDAKKNHYDTMPAASYNYILGVDFGYEDADALAVLAWSEASPVTYLVEELVVPKQGISELVTQIGTLRQRYQISKIVADFGGLGKKISEEIIRRWSIPLEAADKQQKNAAIELMNDALRREHFKARNTSRFAADSMLLEWDIDRSTPEKKMVSNRFHSDILDAALYAFRASPAFAYTPSIPEPKWGTPEWMKREVDEMEQHEIDLLEAQSAYNQTPTY